MAITVGDPIGLALTRTELVLFKPFKLKRWIVINEAAVAKSAPVEVAVILIETAVDAVFVKLKLEAVRLDIATPISVMVSLESGVSKYG